MIMTEQEIKDLEEMKAKMLEKRIATFNYMESVLRWNETDLKHSGYTGKTIAQALEMIMRSAVKDIKKLAEDHIKKYPD